MNSKIICPVNCKYCMASKIEKRSQYWEMGEKIGMNKSCTFINRFPSDPPLKDMNIDWSLFDGEYLGFQGITDCFWNKYYDDLCWLIKKVKKSKIKKLVLTSKIPINEKYIELFNICPNKIIIVYSITGLDLLENTTTNDRLKSIKLLHDNNIDVLPIIHPYIHNYANLSFFKKLKDIGIKYISWKGFRYNPNTMSDLQKYISNNILEQYIDDENEVLIGEDKLKELTKKYKLEYVDLKKYIQKDKNTSGISLEEATEKVNKLSELVVFSTSSTKQDVINYAIKRRL